MRDPSQARTVGGMPIGVTTAAAAASSGAQPPEREEPEMIEVPPGHVWVAGDNMAWSRDSRFYGPMPMGMVLGKIVAHSDPRSDWIVDMVRTKRDELRPARMGEEEEGEGEEWLLNRDYLLKELRDGELEGELEVRRGER